MPSIEQDIRISVTETAPSQTMIDEHSQVLVAENDDVIGEQNKNSVITVTSENYSDFFVNQSESYKYCQSFFAQTYRPEKLHISLLPLKPTTGFLRTGALMPPIDFAEFYRINEKSTPASLETGILDTWDQMFQNPLFSQLNYIYSAGVLTSGTLPPFEDFITLYRTLKKNNPSYYNTNVKAFSQLKQSYIEQGENVSPIALPIAFNLILTSPNGSENININLPTSNELWDTEDTLEGYNRICQLINPTLRAYNIQASAYKITNYQYGFNFSGINKVNGMGYKIEANTIQPENSFLINTNFLKENGTNLNGKVIEGYEDFPLIILYLDSEIGEIDSIYVKIDPFEVNSYADIAQKFNTHFEVNTDLEIKEYIMASYSPDENKLIFTTNEAANPDAIIDFFSKNDLDSLNTPENLKLTAETEAVLLEGKRIPYRHSVQFSIDVDGRTINFSVPLLGIDTENMTWQRFVELANEDNEDQVLVEYLVDSNKLKFTTKSVGNNSRISDHLSGEAASALKGTAASTSVVLATATIEYKPIVFSFKAGAQIYDIIVQLASNSNEEQVYNEIINKISTEASNNIVARLVNINNETFIELNTISSGDIDGDITYFENSTDGLNTAERLRGTENTGAVVIPGTARMDISQVIPSAKKILDAKHIDPIILTISRDFIKSADFASEASNIIQVITGFNTAFGAINQNNTTIIIDSQINNVDALNSLRNSQNARNIIINYVPSNKINNFYLSAAVAARYTSIDYDLPDSIIPAKGLRFNSPIEPYNITNQDDDYFNSLNTNVYTTMSNQRDMYRNGLTYSSSNFQWIELTIGVNVLVRRLKNAIFSIIGNPQFKVNEQGAGILRNICSIVLNQFVANGFLMDNVIEGQPVPAYRIDMPEIKKGVLNRIMPPVAITLYCTQFAYKVNLNITEGSGVEVL